jgi:PAS domain S-box-containing protein
MGRDAKIFAEISKIPGSTLAQATTFRVLARSVAQACGVDRGTIFLVDASGTMAVPATSAFADGHADRAMWASFREIAALRLGAFRFLTHAAPHATAVIADAQRDPRVPAGLAKLYNVKALLAVPLTHEGRTLGVLLLDYVDRRRPFTPEQRRLAAGLADHVAFEIANAGLAFEPSVRESRLRALVQVSQQVSRLQEVESIFSVVSDACRQLFGSTRVDYQIVEGDVLVPVDLRSPAQAGGATRRTRLGEGIGGRVALTGEALLVHNVASDPRLAPEHRAAALEHGHACLLTVPMRIGERVVGVLELWGPKSHGFTEEDVRIATTFASQVAGAIENRRLYGELGRTAQRLHALFEALYFHAVHLATASLSLTELLPHLARATVDLLGADASAIRLLDASETKLELVAHWGMSDAFAGSGPVTLDDSSYSRRALDGEVVLVDLEQTRDFRFRERALAEGFRWAALVPLRLRDRALGHISVYLRAARRLDDEEIALCAQFANLGAIAIENARFYRSAELRAEGLATLSRLVQRITSAGDTHGVFDAVAKAAAALLDARLAQVWSADPERQSLVLRGEFSQLPVDGLEPGRMHAIPYGSALITQVLETRSRQSVADVQSDPRRVEGALERRAGLHAWIGVPMIARDEAIGVLSVFFEDTLTLPADSQNLMQLLADHAAIAIENGRAAERLRAANAQTERVLASISWILIAVDEQNAITQWNEAAVTTFGIPADRVLGRPLVDCGIGWDWPRMIEHITEARERPDPTRLEQIRYRRPDGRDGFLSVSLNPIRSAAGSHAGYLLLGSDITERKLLETQRAERQQLESIGQLAAGIAHEINTPIQFVGDNVRFLQTAFDDLHVLLRLYRDLRDTVESGTATSELVSALARLEGEVDLTYLVNETPKAISQTLEGVTRVATIVRALKDFAHPDHKEWVPTDINRALLSTLTVARNEIKYVADVVTELGDLPLVVCQPGGLNQALLNLVINAAHAIGDVVGDSGARGTITVRTTCEDDMVVIAITDTGNGIPEAVRHRIFDPFFTTKAVGRGTGQGLTIARSVIVDNHGGTLTFETAMGRGTTFFVRVPVARVDGREPR